MINRVLAEQIQVERVRMFFIDKPFAVIERAIISLQKKNLVRIHLLQCPMVRSLTEVKIIPFIQPKVDSETESSQQKTARPMPVQLKRSDQKKNGDEEKQ